MGSGCITQEFAAVGAYTPYTCQIPGTGGISFPSPTQLINVCPLFGEIQPGTGITITDSGGGIFVIAASVASGGGSGLYSDEMAQDAVGTILVDSATIDFTYTDTTPTITASVIDNSLVAGKLTTNTDTILFGRGGGVGSGAGQEITLGSGLTMSSTTLMLGPADTGWSTSNVITDKSFDADATSVDELADVLGTLIEHLKTIGILAS